MERKPLGLQKPESNLIGSGLIPTKNGKGWELPKIESDIFSQEFQRSISIGEKKKVLVLGAGYGTFVYSLLEGSRDNNTEVVVNDLSAEQMAIFMDLLPAEFDGRVTVIAGNFLKEEVNFQEKYFDQILMQNVIHFFTPDEVSHCIKRIYRWLKLGGSLTVTAGTPYWGIFSEDEQAGFIENLKEYFINLKHPITYILPEVNIC